MNIYTVSAEIINDPSYNYTYHTIIMACNEEEARKETELQIKHFNVPIEKWAFIIELNKEGIYNEELK